MLSQKMENLLNLALDATPEELRKSQELDVGYITEANEWELIIKYSERVCSSNCKGISDRSAGGTAGGRLY